jgi:major vault protein
MKYVREQNEMEISKSRDMAAIETDKFKLMVSAIGSDTIRAIAVSGPETQVKMLQALGLKSTLITDGSSPINLFNTAHGLLGSPGDD